MYYQAAAVREYGSAAEMKLSYQRTRARFFEDPELVRSLRATLTMERQERQEEVGRLLEQIAQLQLDKAELVSRLSYASTFRDESATTIDRDKYAFPRVLSLICHCHKVRVSDVKSVDRRYHIVRARMHLIDILTTHRPDLSTTVIGNLIHRDHSTVINARYRWPHVRHKVSWAVVEFDRNIESWGKPVEGPPADE